MLGHLYLKDGNYQDATLYLELACENADLLGDTNWFIYCDMSACYSKVGNEEKAKYYYNLAYEINPNKTSEYINELKESELK